MYDGPCLHALWPETSFAAGANRVLQQQTIERRRNRKVRVVWSLAL